MSMTLYVLADAEPIREPRPRPQPVDLRQRHMSPKDILTPEILGPEQDYKAPNLSPKEFLLAIMRDQKVPLAARMDAAAKVAVFEHPRLAQVNQDVTSGVTIRIEGGLPPLPGTNVIMPTLTPSSTESPPTLHSPKTNGKGE